MGGHVAVFLAVWVVASIFGSVLVGRMIAAGKYPHEQRQGDGQ